MAEPDSLTHIPYVEDYLKHFAGTVASIRVDDQTEMLGLFPNHCLNSTTVPFYAFVPYMSKATLKWSFLKKIHYTDLSWQTPLEPGWYMVNGSLLQVLRKNGKQWKKGFHSYNSSVYKLNNFTTDQTFKSCPWRS